MYIIKVIVVCHKRIEVDLRRPKNTVQNQVQTNSVQAADYF